MMPRTMFDKIWDQHVILEREGNTLLHVDFHFCHDGSFNAFSKLAARGLPVRRPDRMVGTPDHYVPTTSRSIDDLASDDMKRVFRAFERNFSSHGITHFPIGDPRQGIIHVVGPEQGLTQPGLVIVCGDSHTSTHGAVGAIAFGIGASEVAHVMATQALWQKRPGTMRITIDGDRPDGVTGKDAILAIIARIGAVGGTGHAIEYAGSLIRAFSMEERFTVCNMSIEAGARCGMIAPDVTTFDWLRGRPFAPAGEQWDAALAFWKQVPGDAGANFDREERLDGAALSPMVTWGTSPEQAVAVTGTVPDPDAEEDDERRAALEAAVDYMGLAPGQAMGDVIVDRVFIGSCTNSRIEDLRAAAAVVRGRRVRVSHAFVSPGSGLVKRQAEEEGLDRIFTEAGFEWRESACSMCVGMNGDIAQPGERTASTSNRNFRGRQGPGVRTHLASPATAAAAAVHGRFVDIRGL